MKGAIAILSTTPTMVLFVVVVRFLDDDVSSVPVSGGVVWEGRGQKNPFWVFISVFGFMYWATACALGNRKSVEGAREAYMILLFMPFHFF